MGNGDDGEEIAGMGLHGQSLNSKKFDDPARFPPHGSENLST